MAILTTSGFKSLFLYVWGGKKTQTIYFCQQTRAGIIRKLSNVKTCREKWVNIGKKNDELTIFFVFNKINLVKKVIILINWK